MAILLVGCTHSWNVGRPPRCDAGSPRIVRCIVGQIGKVPPFRVFAAVRSRIIRLIQYDSMPGPQPGFTGLERKRTSWSAN